MTDIDQALAQGSACRRIHLDPPQSALAVEQRQFIGQFADAELERQRIREHTAAEDIELKGVQICRSVAIGPPETRLLQVQLRKFSRIQRYFVDTRIETHCLLHHDAAEACPQDGLDRGWGAIFDRHGDGDIGGIRARQRQTSDHMRVQQPQPARRGQFDVLPDARVAVADPRNPIPALGGDEGRAVDRKAAAVLPRAGGDRLLMRDAGMRRRRHAHRQHIALSGPQVPGDIENAADKSALDGAQTHTVQPHLRGVVDAFESQREFPVLPIGRHIEDTSIPIVLPAQGIRDGKIVQSIVRVGIDAACDQSGQHGARDHRRIPTRVVVLRLRQRCTECRPGCAPRLERRSGTHPPGTKRPTFGAARLQAP